MTKLNFDRDFGVTARHSAEIRRVLGEVFVGEAPDHEDWHQATDFMLMGGAAFPRVACRIRRFKYMANYWDEFTVRATRPSGADTELIKVVEGWADYIFYGFETEDEERLAMYFVGDFKKWRRHTHLSGGGEAKQNADGSSSFVAYKIADMPDGFVVHAWPPRFAERLAA